MKDQQQKTAPTQQTSDRKNYRKFIPAAVVALNALIVTVNLVILSLLGKQAEAAVTHRSEILAHELKQQSAQKLTVDLASTADQQQMVLGYLPDKLRLLEVIQFLESLKEVVAVRSFTFESDAPMTDANGYGYLPLFLDLEGTLSQNMVALSRLQRAPFLMTVDQTVIESPGGLSQTVHLRVAMRVYVSEPFAQNQ